MADPRDRLVDQMISVGTVVGMSGDTRSTPAQNALKQLLVIVWRMLSPKSRKDFFHCVDDQMRFVPPKKDDPA